MFFKKYRYKVSVSLPGLEYSRYTRDINDFIYKLQQTKRSIDKTGRALIFPKYYVRISSTGKDWVSTSWNEYWDLVEENLLDIDKVIKYRHKNKDNNSITLRLERNVMTVYSNDLNELKKFSKKFKAVEYCEVKLIPDDVKYFNREPKFKFRTYFKRLNANQHKEFPELLTNYINSIENNANVKINNSAKQSSEKNAMTWWYTDGFFINYNDENYKTFLHLIFPDMLGKTYKLEKRPDK